jgi:D-3-phosphoglycerate dehydrogenase
MEVYGYDPFISVDAAWNLSRSIKHAKSTREIFANCDYITIHVPLNAETNGLVNKESIATMKDGVRILNFARGELVNDTDIIEALASGKVSAYATDFPNENLIGVDGVIAIPHLGASTEESEDNCAIMAVKQIIDYFENGNLVNAVTYPRLVLDRKGANRICVLSKDADAAKISAAVGAYVQSANAVKGVYGYAVYDVDAVSDAAIEAVRAVDGVIAVNVM